MFNIGGGEFLVIALIALIVLGPQRLPDAARQVGKAMGELRRLSAGFQNELKDAFTDSELTGAAPTPRRGALTGAADTNRSVSTAVAAVSQQPAARRTPLKAAPAKKAPLKASPVPRAAAKKATPARKSANTKAAPAPSAPRPTTKG